MSYTFNPFTGNLDVTPFSLDGAGKIPSDYLPSYVDDVVEYDDLAGFPGTGETGKIYVAKDTGYTYRWTGSVYVRIGSGGEVELNLGSEGSPSLFFNGDANTGLYSPGANQLAISTNGTERLRIDSSGRVGIGTSSPAGPLHVSSSIAASTSITNANSQLIIQSGAGSGTNNRSTIYLQPLNSSGNGSPAAISALASGNTNSDLAFYTNPSSNYSGTPTERLRIDSSGRLLVGTSSSSGQNSTLQVVGSECAQFHRGSAGTTPATLNFSKSRNTSYGSFTIVQAEDRLGSIAFRGDDGTDYQTRAAEIVALVDGTPGANEMPGRLVFSTTADGASSPTERMRITSDAYVRLASGTGGIQFNGDTAAANALDDYEEGTWTPALAFGGASTGITYNSRQGYYVKIGKQVFLTVYFNLSGKGTATGSATVTGLPFTAEDFNISGTSNWPGAEPSRRQNETSTNFAMMVGDNTATINCTNGSGVAITDATFTNGTIIECALTYRAA